MPVLRTHSTIASDQFKYDHITPTNVQVLYRTPTVFAIEGSYGFDKLTAYYVGSGLTYLDSNPGGVLTEYS